MTADSSERSPKRGAMSFRSKASQQPRLSSDEARRQGEITQLAFRLLGGREEALAFLNHEDDALQGRPLDIAIASDVGFANVEQALRQMTDANRESS